MEYNMSMNDNEYFVLCCSVVSLSLQVDWIFIKTLENYTVQKSINKNHPISECFNSVTIETHTGIREFHMIASG